MVKPKQSKNELSRSDLIKTPQSLIHIRHKITLSQYKYWILMLRELRRQFDSGIPMDEKGFRSMPLKLFEQAFGYEINRSMLWNDMLALKNGFKMLFTSKGGPGPRPPSHAVPRR